MFQILQACTDNITSCCSDYAIATYVYVVKQVLDIMHIVIPILLIAMGTVDFIKLISNPDDNGGKTKKSLLNKVIATFIVFFIPYIITLVMNLLVYTTQFSNFKFEIGNCWTAADNVVTLMNEQAEYDMIAEKEQALEEKSYGGVTIKKDKVKITKIKKKNKKSKKNSSDSEADQLVKYAKKFKGNKYVYGGTSLTNGIDCSGFVMRVYEHFGYKLPRTSKAQAKVGKSVSPMTANNLKKGDIIYYGLHVSLYIGNGKVIHASNPSPYPSGGIKVSVWNYRNPLTIRRILK